MATYSNIGIKLITTGDESGTWGTSTNTNFSDVLDEAIAGAVTYNISSDADFTLTVSDGTSSDARHAVIKFTSTTLTATRVCTFAPNDLQKTWVVINSTTGGQSLTFKQGSAGGTVTVPNGESAIIYSDGGGSSAGAVTRVLDSFTNTKITTGTLNATTLDLTNLEVTNIKAKDGTSAASIADSTGVISVTASPILSAGTANQVQYLNGSKVLSGSSNLTFDGTTLATTTVDATNVEVTNIKAKDGTAAASIADSTGVISLTSNPTLSGGSANGVLYLDGSKVATSGSALRFDGTNLGIGTVAALPVAPLSIGDGSVLQFYGVLDAFPSATSDTAAVIGRTGGSGVAPFNNAGSLIYRPRVTATAGRSSHIFYTGSPSAERLRIDESGNVGIGTTSPIYKLHVENNAASTTNIAVLNTSASSGAYAQVRVQGDSGIGYFGYAGSGNAAGGLYDADCVYLASESTAAALCIGTSGGSAPIRFFTNGSTAASERMRLDSSGNLGIGTSSPGFKLDVQSATATFRLQSTTGTNAAYLWATNTGGDFYFGRDNSTGSTFGTNSAYSAILYSANAYPMVFFTNATERMRLDSSGNLGLGVTPSAWASNFLPVLQIKTGTAGVGTLCGTANDNFRMFCNAYYDGAAYKRIGAGYATVYQQDTGGHSWFTAGTSTAGSTITFTEVARLSNNSNGVFTVGNVGSVAGLGTDFATIGAYGANGGGFRIYRGSGAGTANSYIYGDVNQLIIATQENIPMAFYTNNAERARFNTTGAFVFAGGTTTADGIGITFPATQSASSNANTLDDYEEGTWTGTVSPNTSGTITLITSDDTGAYTKIGRQVTVTGHFQVTSVSSPVGVLVSISGLPFTIGDGTETSQRGSGSVMFYDNSASTASTRPVDYLEGQTSFRVWIDASTVETNDSFIFTVTYFV